EFAARPSPRDGEPVTECAIAAADLQTTLRFCAHAASNEENRYYLDGVFFGADGAACATDSKRMAVRRLAGLCAPERGIILPPPTCRRLSRVLLRDAEGMVSLQITERLAAFSAGPWVLVSKLIDGTYPSYRRILPERASAPAVVDRRALLAATKRAALVLS